MKKEIIKKIRQFFEDSTLKKEKKSIKSIYIINSLARGDFIKGVSDIDILVIFKKGVSLKNGSKIAAKISNLLKPDLFKYKTAHKGEVLDIPWEIDGRYEKSKINCFRYFADDLKKYHIHIYGEDIIPKLKLKNATRALRKKRIQELIKHIDNETDIKQINMITGSIIRHFLYTQGIKTLNKYEIVKELEKLNYPDILTFYKNCIKNKANTKKQAQLNRKIINEIAVLMNE